MNKTQGCPITMQRRHDVYAQGTALRLFVMLD